MADSQHSWRAAITSSGDGGSNCTAEAAAVLAVFICGVKGLVYEELLPRICICIAMCE